MKSSRSALGNHRTWQASFGRWAQMTCWNWLFCSLWEAPEFAYWRSRRCCCGEHSDDGKTRRHPLSPSRLAPTPDRPCKSPKKGRPPGQWRTALKVPCDEPTGGMTHRRVEALSCKTLPLLTRSCLRTLQRRTTMGHAAEMEVRRPCHSRHGPLICINAGHFGLQIHAGSTHPRNQCG